MRKILLLFFFSLTLPTLNAQQVEIRGRVVSSTDGSGLPGVNIVIEGTTQGTTTDIDGNYSVSANPGDVLVFTMVGMEPKKYTVGNQTTLNVSLNEDSRQLGEVVVTGYQEIDRRLFTGAADGIQMKDIEIKAEPDISRMLDGQVAGVFVENVSGTFGTSPKIRIRGNTSINGNNQPLYVVDGVILEDLNTVNTNDFVSGNPNTLVSSSIANLNADDIESWEILKDASATATYGARAANGVIVIKQKGYQR